MTGTKKCTKCGVEKLLNKDNFYAHNDRGGKFRAACKTCCNSYLRQYKQTGSFKEYKRNHSLNNRAKLNAYTKKSRDKAKRLVFQHYSGATIPFCKCCGTTVPEFLTLDHVNNDGAADRKQKRRTGSQLCEVLVKEKFPSGFQILCYNCNCSKNKDSFCPGHKKFLG